MSPTVGLNVQFMASLLNLHVNHDYFKVTIENNIVHDMIYLGNAESSLVNIDLNGAIFAKGNQIFDCGFIVSRLPAY